MMQEIKSLSQFNKLKANSLLIIDFYAVWCGPCKVISPGFDKLAKQHESSTSIVFAKVDVDKAKDVAQECRITAMPTFQFFKEGKKVDEVKGADVQQLTTKVGYYTAAVAKEDLGQASTSRAGESTTGNAKDAATGPISLRSMIDVRASQLVNASTLSKILNIASPPPAGYAVASASGSRLLIHLSFTQAVTPSHLKIAIAKDSISSAPSRIIAGTNIVPVVIKSSDGAESSDLNMDSLDKAENVQSFNIYSDEYTGGITDLKLKASKFTAITSLTIRIDANMSGEATTLSKVGELDIIGSTA